MSESKRFVKFRAYMPAQFYIYLTFAIINAVTGYVLSINDITIMSFILQYLNYLMSGIMLGKTFIIFNKWRLVRRDSKIFVKRLNNIANKFDDVDKRVEFFDEVERKMLDGGAFVVRTSDNKKSREPVEKNDLVMFDTCFALKCKHYMFDEMGSIPECDLMPGKSLCVPRECPRGKKL